MAEIVEYRIEKTLEDAKFLGELGVIDTNELTATRQKFEYTLRRRNVTPVDQLKYIKYEIDLLKTIERYKKKAAERYQKKKQKISDIDKKIHALQTKKLNLVIRSQSARISTLFRKLTIRHQFDKKLWLAYIDFARARGWRTRAAALYWRALRVNSDPDLWIAAAKFQAYSLKSYDAARKLFLMALRHHAQNSMVWSEYFKLEVSYLEIIASRAEIIFKPKATTDEAVWEADQEEEEKEKVPTLPKDDITKGELPLTVYKNALETLNDPRQFLVSILVYLAPEQSQVTTRLKKEICSDIRTRASENDPKITSDIAELCDNPQQLISVNSNREEPKSPKPECPILACFKKKGLDAARTLFLKLEKSIKQSNLKLYTTIIEIDNDPANKRQYYEKAVEKFGKTNWKLWCNYIKFECETATSLDDLTRISGIYNRALKVLEPKLADKVIETYSLIQAKVEVNVPDYSDVDD